MVREDGYVRYKRGRKQKDGGRIYIIRYREGLEQKEIRFKEKVDTDASFHSGDRIIIETRDDLIIVTNHTLKFSIEGTKV